MLRFVGLAFRWTTTSRLPAPVPTLATRALDTGKLAATLVTEGDTRRLLIAVPAGGDVRAVAFSADGTQLYSGDRTRWDLRTGRGLRVASRSPGEMSYGIASPDGRVHAMMRPNSNVLSLLEVASGRELSTLTPSGEAGVVQRVRFSADGSMLAATYGQVEVQQPTVGSFSRGSQVKIWDVKTGRELHALTLNDIPAEADFSADGRVMATIGTMGQVSLLDVQSGSKLRDLTSSPMSSLTTAPPVRPGQMPTIPNMADIAAMMNNIWGSLAAGTMGRTITSLAFSPDGKTLVTGGFESKTNIDFAALMSGAMSGQRPKGQKGSKPPDPQDFMKDLKVEVIGEVKIWDVATGRWLREFGRTEEATWALAAASDGRSLYAAGSDGLMRAWAVLEPFARTYVTSMVPGADLVWLGDRLLVIGADTQPVVWEAVGAPASGIRLRPGMAGAVLGVPCAIVPRRPEGVRLCRCLPETVKSVIREGSNHQPRPARQRDDPDPAGPGDR